jgi:transposase
MGYYIGLDISQLQTAICIIDERGAKTAEGKALTIPSEIYEWIARHVDPKAITKVGHEAGFMSSWIYTEMSKLGLPMLCLEAYLACQFLKVQRNKTDKNDAHGLAQLVRMGGEFIKPVVVRSQASQEVRALFTLRDHLVGEKLGLENTIAGTLKPFGLRTQRGGKSPRTFCERVLLNLAKADEQNIDIREAITPLLEVYEVVCEKLDGLNKKVHILAQTNPICPRLMTAPGVKSVVSLAFVAAIEDPRRFKNISDVGAFLGLTPKEYQSGEIDIKGHANRRGDIRARTHLIQAATVLLTSTKTWFPLKAWGMKIAKRHGFGVARVAVARKLAIILCRMWINEENFRWTRNPADTPLAGSQAA